MTERTVSVIVNTYDRAESLALTLAALEQLDYRAFEVVVVNGPSRDGTEDLLDRYRGRITVGRCLERNLSRSRNIGVRLAAGEIVAFIDDDAYPDPAWLDRLVEAYDDPEVAAAGGPTYNYTGTDVQAWRSFVDRFGNARVDHVARAYPGAVTSAPFTTWVPYTIGTNCSFRREVLVGIGGFDEEFEYYLEESDVCCRLVGLGYVVAQLDDGFVYHKFLPSWVRDRPDVVKDYRQVLKSKLYFSLKHGLAAASFREVCADIVRFVEKCATEVDEAVAAGRLAESDRTKFETDAAEMSDAALCALRAPEPRTRPPEWFGRVARPLLAFSTGAGPDRLHVCLTSAEYPPTRVNGIGRVVHALATGLADAGHVVHVVTRGDVSRRVDLEEGVWVHRVPVTPHAPGPDLAVPRHIWDLSASFYDEVLLIDGHRALDVLQAPNWDSEGLAAIWDGRIPVVVGLYTPLKTLTALDPRVGAALDGSDPSIRDMVALERYCYEHADGLLACGPSVVAEIESRYELSVDRRRLGLVAHGLVDRAGGARPAAAGPRVGLLFVGRLEPRKGVDVLLECAAGLLARHGGLEITIAGDDSVPTLDGSTMRAHFERTAPKDLRARVRFLGPVDDDALLSLYAACDIVVVPSRFESFGLMLLEAMMFAKPVVASDVGGMREIVVDGETGRLVPAGDPDALAGALDDLLGQPELRRRLGAAGRRRYEERFSRGQMVDGVSRFYRSVVGSHGRGAAVGAGAPGAAAE
ncbi:MAG TPA: glycosyltransferase [Acidimicrobiales bacterium]|nr:glycosyltransferase [Acidimicrobiales bacterium]